MQNLQPRTPPSATASGTTVPTILARMNNQIGQYYLRYLRHHSTRASPVTIQWLLQNFETAEGVSLPRSALYSHYLNHCMEFWLEPMNAASFGKLIRSVFVGLRTRRLGTRPDIGVTSSRVMPELPTATRTLGTSFGSSHGYSPKVRSARLNPPMGTLVPSYPRLQNDVLLGGPLPDTAAAVNAAMVSSPTAFSVGAKFGASGLVSTREPAEMDYGAGSVGLALKLEPDVHDQLQSYSGRSGFMIKPTSSLSRQIPSGEKESFSKKPNSLKNNSVIWRPWEMSQTTPRGPSSSTSTSVSSSSACSTSAICGSRLGQKTIPGVTPLSTTCDWRGSGTSEGSKLCLVDSIFQSQRPAARPLSTFDSTLHEPSQNLLTQSGVDNLKALSPTNGVYDDSFERISFGSGSDQQFSFPRIWDLCRMAGLDIGQTRGPNPYSLDLSSGNADQGVSLKTERERQEIAQFVQLYEKHCVEVYAAIITPQLEKLRNIWQQFWRPVETSSTQQELGSLDGTCTNRLSNAQLLMLTTQKPLCQFIELADRALYQTLLEIIVADSLKSMSPLLLHTVRLMVKRIQHFLRSALRQLSPTLINCKLTAISGFIKGLRRAIGLAHLSRAVVHVLETPERLEQMKMDVSKLDLDSIEAQGSWASDCLPTWTSLTDPLPETPEPTTTDAEEEEDDDEEEEDEEEEALREAGSEDEEEAERGAGAEDSVLTKKSKTAVTAEGASEKGRRRANGGGITLVQLHSELHTLISVKASLSCWIVWLDKIVHRCLSSRASGPKRANAARHLMLVWNYYSSLLMRELTLRSALSFGSCYLLRMLCDEYLSFRLEQVASSPLMTLPVDYQLTDKTTSGHNSLDVLAPSVGKDLRLCAPSTSHWSIGLTSATNGEEPFERATLTSFNSSDMESMDSNDMADLSFTSPVHCGEIEQTIAFTDCPFDGKYFHSDTSDRAMEGVCVEPSYFGFDPQVTDALLLGTSGLTSDIWQVSDTLNSASTTTTGLVGDPSQLSKPSSSALAPTFVAETLVDTSASGRPRTAQDAVECDKEETGGSSVPQHQQPSCSAFHQTKNLSVTHGTAVSQQRYGKPETLRRSLLRPKTDDIKPPLLFAANASVTVACTRSLQGITVSSSTSAASAASPSIHSLPVFPDQLFSSSDLERQQPTFVRFERPSEEVQKAGGGSWDFSTQSKTTMEHDQWIPRVSRKSVCVTIGKEEPPS
nr:unnamed protein product [Spirometra erinaceieuropaei]